MKKKITRRFLLGASGSVVAAKSAFARLFRGAGGAPPASQTISSITPTSAGFAADVASGLVTPLTITMSPTSPSFSGSLSLSGTNSGAFQLSGNDLDQAPSTGTAAGTYTDTNAVATQAGISNSPFMQALTLTGFTAGGAFVIGEVLAGTPGYLGDDANGWGGMNITVGSNNLTVTALGRWKLAGNSLSHTLQIFDGPSLSPIGDSVIVDFTGGMGTVGQFNYATLPTPVVLQAGRTYIFVSSENTFLPADQIYENGNTFTTTADATLNGGAEQDVMRGTQWFLYTNQQDFGPVNFQYTVTPTAIATLAGSPFYPLQGRVYDAPGGDLFELPGFQVVSGTITVDGTWAENNVSVGGYPQYSVVAQWMIDEQPASPYLRGPVGVYPNGPNFPWTFDTATHPLTPDGTHSLRLRFIDSTSAVNASQAYSLRCEGSSLIVQNIGPTNGAQIVPVHATNANYGRMYPNVPDFMTYPGDTVRSVNTFPYPYPSVPPAYNASAWAALSPPINFNTDPAALRSPGNLYTEHLTALRTREYETDQNFATTPSGGVFVSQYHAALALGFTTAAVPYAHAHFNWDGGRYDNRVDPGSTYIHDPLGNGYVGVELMGRVVTLGFDGTVHTLAGITLNRSVLAFDYAAAQGYTDAQILSRMTVVGTIGSPSFTQWWGLNDICFDPRDTTWNTAYIVNGLTQIIIKLTNLQSGNPTCTRFAGTEFSAGYSGDSGPATSAHLDQPLSCIMDPAGNMYIADSGNVRIRKIDASGVISTFIPPSSFGGQPQFLRFSSDGDIVWVEAASGPTLRRYFLSGPNIGTIFTIGVPAGYAGGFGSNFQVFDIDNPIYPHDFTGGTGTPGVGACGPIDDIVFLSPPQAGPTTASRVSIDGSYNAPFQGDTAAMSNPSFQGSGGDDYESNLIEGWPVSNAAVIADALGVYSWIIAFSRTQAHFACAGYRYNGVTAQRAQLPNDPAQNVDTLTYPHGQSVWRWGSSQAFPFGIRPGFNTLLGMAGFSHLGSDVAPTVHDIARCYNGGTAAYQGTLTTYAMTSMTWSSTGGGQAVIVMAVSTYLLPTDHAVYITGATNSGPGGNAAVTGLFKIISFTNDQHFTVSMPGSGIVLGGTPVLNTGDAIMQAFMAAGATGSVPRPELGVAPGSSAINNDWVALSYFIRRATTAGSYPGPVALPGPKSTDVIPPVISEVSAVRLSFSSIQVNWSTDKVTIGLACAGSAGGQVYQYPYSVWSPIESAYASGTHSAVITGLPMSIPTYYSVLAKDEVGNSSYIAPMQIGITPDSGPVLEGGLTTVPGNTTKFVNNYGEWSYGPGVAPQPGGGTTGAFYLVTLNGKLANCGNSNLLFAQQLWVGFGGGLYAKTFDQIWVGFMAYGWYGVTDDGNYPNNLPNQALPHGLPSPINPPFGPISPDGTTLTSSSGTLITADGMWAINSSGSYPMLNGINLLNGGGSPTIGAVNELQVNAHGQMFLRDSSNNWWAFLGYVPQSSTGPQSGPIPVSITFSRSSFGISHSAALGTVMATLTVSMSDGSVFAGSFSVGLDGNGHQSGAITGSGPVYDLVYNYAYSSSPGAIGFSITATQNGSSFMISFDEQLT